MSCSGHGVCDDGVFGSGACTCRAQFTGLACDVCLTDNCVHGSMLLGLHFTLPITSAFCVRM